MEDLVSKLPESVQYVLMGLGAIFVAIITYVGISPSKEDDKWLDKMRKNALVGPLINFLIKISPIKPKSAEKDLGNLVAERAEKQKDKEGPKE
jgi:hypothetical protein